MVVRVKFKDVQASVRGMELLRLPYFSEIDQGSQALHGACVRTQQQELLWSLFDVGQQ